MSRQIIFRTPTSVQRQQPLLKSRSSSNSSSSSGGSGRTRNSAKFREFFGGTTAECAAICCCCPCTIANIIVLTFYKVPVGLCRRALRMKRRRKLQKKGLLQPKKRTHCGFDGTSELQICVEDVFPDVKWKKRCAKDSMALDFLEVPLREEGRPEELNNRDKKYKQFHVCLQLLLI
ncbi:Detected protein of unknown function [Hibiscus syriacus]|uniref:Uncharacterized protein n=1 Tax=Hibiscus syriacus TaxID=106335 RepID=A0A6A3CAK0_HIBSY|nr:Detected protein of unknown function [Hibiscus syriacus]